ncbi:GumC family protein [Aurantiacibacter poecillastricola]|uniref:GumC family protein n=1 Tax=Aurantiacibacter poecillastricola TaxID=3064385 RepID=UPI00273DD3B6|nr:polysaccharide biosynthesis tyrosine autokinase [Aurantiacibacter sp. 219JJ12-13]MDP5263224.1 polysaccharide biosynthesis tyrosine autokinase [Aurantiacibacter sp. 219JJ12-13]
MASIAGDGDMPGSDTPHQTREQGTPREWRFLPDPQYLWSIFRRRQWTFVLVTGVVLLLGLAWLLTRPALYSATASVMIEPSQPDVVEGAPVSPDLGRETNVIDTEVEILSSPRLAGRVADALDLASYEEFGGGARDVTFDADEPGTHPLAGAVLSRTDVRRSGLTFLIDITATTRDSELSAALANEVARQYLLQQEETKGQTNEEAREFLQTRLVELREQAAQADAALQSYKVRNGLMSAEGATMAEQEVSILNQEISSARAALAEKEGQLAAARRRVSQGGGGAEVPAALQSGTVAELRQREALLTGQLANYEARFGELHPEVRQAREELADVRSQIQLQIDRVMSSLASDVEAARSRVASLEASQSQAEGALMSNNVAQVDLMDLERNAEAARAIYQTFLERAQQLASQEGLIRPDASIESLARVPGGPSSPNYPMWTILLLVAAVTSGLAAIAVAEYLDARIRTRSDVEDRVGLAYLGAVPDLASTAGKKARGISPWDYLLDHPQSTFAESIRALRSSLILGRNTRSRSIAITSALPREGKSTTALCLARAMAESGISTVLVDCDGRRHAVSDALLPEGWNGLGRYLNREGSLDEALSKDPASSLHVLGDNTGRISELFVHRPFQSLLGELQERFQMVVIDTAPVLGIAETRRIASEVDRVLMVARWRSTGIRAVDTATDILAETGAEIAGLALTRVDVRKYASTGQRDVYGYRSEFAGYYAD